MNVYTMTAMTDKKQHDGYDGYDEVDLALTVYLREMITGGVYCVDPCYILSSPHPVIISMF